MTEGLKMDKELIESAVELLETGDSTGCDGLIVVDIRAYQRLQKAVKDATGIVRGEDMEE
jgi:hypothetical protein